MNNPIIRNEIEKQGLSPIKSGTTEIKFAPHAGAREKVGTMYHDGKVVDVMGQIEHILYFDKGQKKEIMTSCSEYLTYLKTLVKEAIIKFPENRKGDVKI